MLSKTYGSYVFVSQSAVSCSSFSPAMIIILKTRVAVIKVGYLKVQKRRNYKMKTQKLNEVARLLREALKAISNHLEVRHIIEKQLNWVLL